jgi:TRAP-type C4-dicarboxylate transport system permease small subunit
MLLVSVLLICANVFARYVLFKPVIWAEEVLGYALVWMVYLGAVQVTWDRTHLRMDLLYLQFSGFWRRFADIAAAFLFLAAGGLIIYQSITSIAKFTHQSQVAGLPMYLVHLVVPVSFAVMMLCILVRSFSGKKAGSAGDRP